MKASAVATAGWTGPGAGVVPAAPAFALSADGATVRVAPSPTANLSVASGTRAAATTTTAKATEAACSARRLRVPSRMASSRPSSLDGRAMAMAAAAAIRSTGRRDATWSRCSA